MNQRNREPASRVMRSMIPDTLHAFHDLKPAEMSVTLAAPAVVPSVRKATRLTALDWMRGVVMVLMAIDHSSRAFNGGRLVTDSFFSYHPGTPLPVLQFLTRFITHLCAPTFVFLAGTGLAFSVEHQIAKRTREGVPPKTPRSRRTIPLPTVVSEALAEHIREFPPAANGLLFHTSTGLPIHHEYYTSHAFAPAVARAGLPAGTTSHDLRHAYASWLLAEGESVIAVAERLGHENATLVLTTYGHLVPGSDDRTRKAIDGVWKAAPDTAQRAATAQGLPG